MNILCLQAFASVRLRAGAGVYVWTRACVQAQTSLFEHVPACGRGHLCLNTCMHWFKHVAFLVSNARHLLVLSRACGSSCLPEVSDSSDGWAALQVKSLLIRLLVRFLFWTKNLCTHLCLLAIQLSNLGILHSNLLLQLLVLQAVLQTGARPDTGESHSKQRHLLS